MSSQPSRTKHSTDGCPTAQRAIHLFALCSLAVAQPLLDLLGHNAVLLIAHRLGPLDLVLLLGLLLLVPPAVLWLLLEIAGRASQRLGSALFTGLIAITVTASALPPLKQALASPPLATLALSLGLGVFAALAYVRLRVARRFVSLLAVGPLVFVVGFVANDNVRALLLPTDSANAHAQGVPSAQGSGVSVVMVVFDELPTTSLLDEDGQIDPLRYPAFAGFARDATWYRNASTVHTITESAVPAILTGRYPQAGKIPTAADHPRNLFTLFGGHHELHVVEPLTALLAAPGADDGGGRFARLSALLSDVWIVYLHVLLPEEWGRGLPPVDTTWGAFGQGASWDPGLHRGPAFADRLGSFRDFVRSIPPARSEDPPGLHFLHSLLPHAPYQYLPSGRAYFPPTDYDYADNMWGEQEWWVIQGYQRHLLQLELADSLLGTLLARLKELGRYDDSLVVVTADHGAGFWAGESRRDPGRMQHPEELMAVPLLIKAPGQREGRVSLRNAETIDILPTLAELAGIEVPWRTDGCSLVAADCPERAHKILYDWDDERHRFDAGVLDRRASLERRLALFGSGRRPNGLYAIGRYGALVGQPLAQLPVDEAGGTHALLLKRPFQSAASRPAKSSTARLTGILRPGPACQSPPELAFATHGTVRAVAPAFARQPGSFLFSVLVPEADAPRTLGELEILCVSGSPASPRLAASRVSFGSFRGIPR